MIQFKITEDTYEYIVTNLDKDEFVIQDIKELYHLQWEIETSYRELKYDLGLNTLHAKKQNLIEQEIYAKMLVYSFCSRITNGIDIAKQQRKYKYQFDFIRAFHIIRKHLKRKKVSICFRKIQRQLITRWYYLRQENKKTHMQNRATLIARSF